MQRPSCVAMDCIIRVIGAVALWSVEIVMQLRIYVIYHCSKRVGNFLSRSKYDNFSHE